MLSHTKDFQLIHKEVRPSKDYTVGVTAFPLTGIYLIVIFCTVADQIGCPVCGVLLHHE